MEKRGTVLGAKVKGQAFLLEGWTGPQFYIPENPLTNNMFIDK